MVCLDSNIELLAELPRSYAFDLNSFSGFVDVSFLDAVEVEAEANAVALAPESPTSLVTAVAMAVATTAEVDDRALKAVTEVDKGKVFFANRFDSLSATDGKSSVLCR